MSFDKLKQDGKVAVIISRGFGAGWSTWASDNAQRFCMDAEIAQAVLDGDTDKACALATQIDEGFYTGGAKGLEIVWVQQGDRFEIHEYDGRESIRVFGPDDGFVA